MSNFVSNAHAGTTTADFLEWDRAEQESYLQNTIGMAGVIASQAKPEIARCLDEWYFTQRQKRNAEILELMPQYKTYSPNAVVLAVINDVCGRF